MQSNVPEFSVGELAFAVKKSLEDNFGRVRVRGEFSRVTFASSGHMYSSLKDDKGVIDAVCWKGKVSQLSIRPEEGMEVIVTGKLSSYPGRSTYQIVIDAVELAGEGALLKLLEDRKKKLAAEGLFDQSRKKTLPFIPERIGVVTSPTGAVIRDILHRLADRFPRPVLVWGVPVQGQGSDVKIAAAIDGFNALSGTHRPDVIIVARGGGSLEDLMPFNEESVVRAVANSEIPVISAVGHETDTTLIDYASDMRAPTPTGAAEMVVPVKANLSAQVMDDVHRLFSALSRIVQNGQTRVETAARGLGDPERLLAMKSQAFDHVVSKFSHGLQNRVSHARVKYERVGARLSVPKQTITRAEDRLKRWGEQLQHTKKPIIKTPQDRIKQLDTMLEAYSYQNVLSRGFAVVRDQQGKIITEAGAARAKKSLSIGFKNDEHVDVFVNQTPEQRTLL